MSGRLAIDGGKPVRKKPFPPRIMLDGREKTAALRVIEKSMTGPDAIDMFGQGPEVEAYRAEFAQRIGTRFAAAVSSGTAAVHTALAALRLEPGAEVITSPITDPGTVTPIVMINCIPIFADVDYATLNVTADTIAAKVTKHTKAIIPVHLAGQPCDMAPIMKLARKHKQTVIEDCAQAHGSTYHGKCVGTIGDLGTFSLMGSKHMTSGGQGGMVTTNNQALFWNAKRFADRGKPFNSRSKSNIMLGLNYRMSELEAAIGRPQLKKLPGRIRKRRTLLKKLQKALSPLQAHRPWTIIDETETNPWFIPLHYDRSRMTVSKAKCAAAIGAEGIRIAAHYVTPMYWGTWLRQRASYGKSQYPWSGAGKRRITYEGSCPEVERAYADHMTLYFHEGFEDGYIQDIAAAPAKV